MKEIVCLLLLWSFTNVCFAELIPVSVARSDDKQMEHVQGRCEREGLNLVCHLTETTVRTDKAICQVSTRQYVLTLQQQGPTTWGTWGRSPVCNLSEAVTIELAPTPTALAFPGVLKYTVKSIVESRKDVSEFCAGIKDEEIWVFLQKDAYSPQSRKCAEIQFSL